jgi:hypothetical protein
VEESPFLPQSLLLESDSTRAGWAQASNQLNGGQLEKAMTAAGWTSFFMAGSIRTRVFGFDRQRTIRAALKRLIATVKLNKCNCLEFDAVTTHTFLGVPYVNVSAHGRWIQKKAALVP